MAESMRHGVPTVQYPTDPKSIYFRNLYRTFFFGPFTSESEASSAISVLDKADPMWDYDPFCMIYGADPLPKDFVFGFPEIPQEIRDRILSGARGAS